jgi:hypothetical protein
MKASGRRLIVLIAAVVVAASVTFNCKVRRLDSEPEPPARPASVPANAVWAGGVDGGSFILLEPTKKANQYSARIYGDSAGDVMFDGVLQVDQQGTASLDVRNPKTFSFWDGDTLYLTDGRSLSPRPR